MKFVVDTNIVFSAILNTNSRIASLLIESKDQFQCYAPVYLLSELDVHRSKIKQILKISLNEIIELQHLVTHNIHFISEYQISEKNWLNAENITAPVDGDDIAFVALALELSCPLWTGDKKLQKIITLPKILSTEQIFEILNEQ